MVQLWWNTLSFLPIWILAWRWHQNLIVRMVSIRSIVIWDISLILVIDSPALKALLDALKEGDEMIESTKNNVPKVRVSPDYGSMSTESWPCHSRVILSFQKRQRLVKMASRKRLTCKCVLMSLLQCHYWMADHVLKLWRISSLSIQATWIQKVQGVSQVWCCSGWILFCNRGTKDWA